MDATWEDTNKINKSNMHVWKAYFLLSVRKGKRIWVYKIGEYFTSIYYTISICFKDNSTTNQRLTEREIMGISSFTKPFKKLKYVGVKLTKNVKVLFAENYATLKEKIEGDIRKWKNIPCSWPGRNEIVKMAILSKLLYRFNAILIKKTLTCPTSLEKTLLKIIWWRKKLRISKPILGNTCKAGDISIPNLKVHSKAIVLKLAWYWQRNRPKDQWNRLQDVSTTTKTLNICHICSL